MGVGKKILITVVVVVAAIALFLASPRVVDKEVAEKFPAASKPAPAPPKQVASRKDEAASPQDLENSKEEILAAAAREPAHEMHENMPGQADSTIITQGRFKDADVIRRGSGDAKLYKLADGSHLLRLENFNVTNGPALHVYLAKHASPESAADVTEGGFLDLGNLKGNVGNQNYPVPEDEAIADYKSAVIWCQLFSVMFSPASLQ